MTSRVQKGGPIFRPVKSRARPEISQASPAPADNPGIVHHVSSPSLTASLPASSETSSADPPVISVAASPSNVIPSTTSIAVTRMPPNIAAPPPVLSRRNTPAPPILVSRVTPIPVITNFKSSLLSSTSSVQTQSSTFAGSPSTISNSLILPAPGTENLPLSSSNTHLSVNPKSSAQKAANTTSNPISTLEGEQANSIPVSKPKRKTSTTSRKTPAKGKRKNSNSDGEGTDDDATKPAATKRKRCGSSTPRSRRSRGPSLPPFDPNADPGEEIDPTVVTMASLCSDTGQGRVSSKAAEILSNHAAWKIQNREKRARMKALMELKKYGREEEAEALEATQATPSNKVLEADSSQIRSAAPAISDDTGNEFDYTQDLTTSRFNVQVRIGPNGETVIDEESLVVDRIEAEDTTNYTHVVESDHTKFVNSGSYGKRYRGSRWSAEETELFFDALAQYGENYELIAYILPGRDRKSCKNKFKAEDKKNPARINHCLNNRRPVDMATLSRMTGKDFSGPVPEIRVPTPQPLVQFEASSAEQEAAAPEPVRKKPKKRKSQLDDGAVVVGDADNFVPFPPSP